MADPIRPTGVSAFGKECWYFVPVIANPKAPSVAEINAVTGLNLTCRLYREGGGELSIDSEKVTSPERLCDTETYERTVSRKVSISDLLASLDPQGAVGSEGKAAFEELTSGVTGFLVRRQGLPKDVAVASGHFVDVIPAEFHQGIPDKTGTGKEAEFAVKIPVDVTGPVEWNVPVAA